MRNFNFQFLCNASTQDAQSVIWKSFGGLSIQHEQKCLSPVDAGNSRTLNLRKTTALGQLCACCYIKDEDPAISGYGFQNDGSDVRSWQISHHTVNCLRCAN